MILLIHRLLDISSDAYLPNIFNAFFPTLDNFPATLFRRFTATCRFLCHLSLSLEASRLLIGKFFNKKLVKTIEVSTYIELHNLVFWTVQLVKSKEHRSTNTPREKNCRAA